MSARKNVEWIGTSITYVPAPLEAPFDPARCAVRVYPGNRQEFRGRQCGRKATQTFKGYGVCSFHGNKAKESR